VSRREKKRIKEEKIEKKSENKERDVLEKIDLILMLLHKRREIIF